MMKSVPSPVSPALMRNHALMQRGALQVLVDLGENDHARMSPVPDSMQKYHNQPYSDLYRSDFNKEVACPRDKLLA
jgi:hypothetical protein